MPVCFCAVEELSADTVKREFTYLGYLCSCDDEGECTVSAASEIRIFKAQIAEPWAPSMPEVDDPCSCQHTYCVGEGYGLPSDAARQTAAPVKPKVESYYGRAARFNSRFEVLGVWDAESPLGSRGHLRLILLGLPRKCEYLVFGFAFDLPYRTGNDVGIHRFEECEIQYTADYRALFVGTSKGSQLGPFFIRYVLPSFEPEAAEAEAAEAAPVAQQAPAEPAPEPKKRAH